MTEYIVVKPIPVEELKDHKDYVGYLFKNGNNKFNICDTLEDIQKSNQWFQNLPVNSIVVSDEKISEGDRVLVTCPNRGLNGKTYKFDRFYERPNHSY